MRREPGRHHFDLPDVAAFHSFVATTLNVFIFGSVLMMVGQTRPNSGGVIEDQTAFALIGFFVVVVFCIPLFLASVGLAIYACYKHDSWGFASLFLNGLLVGGLVLFFAVSKVIDTPERRAALEKQARERWAQRQAPPSLGGIDISTDSILYKAATSRWVRITCLSAIGIGALLLARKRAASNLMSQTPDGFRVCGDSCFSDRRVSSVPRRHQPCAGQWWADVPRMQHPVFVFQLEFAEFSTEIVCRTAF